MNRGQRIAKQQSYAEAKIAIEGVENKQQYSSSLVMEDKRAEDRQQEQEQAQENGEM